jgi:hypothetical protein
MARAKRAQNFSAFDFMPIPAYVRILNHRIMGKLV